MGSNTIPCFDDFQDCMGMGCSSLALNGNQRKETDLNTTWRGVIEIDISLRAGRINLNGILRINLHTSGCKPECSRNTIIVHNGSRRQESSRPSPRANDCRCCQAHSYFSACYCKRFKMSIVLSSAFL